MPAPLLIYEDSVVRIKLITTLNENLTLLSLNASYYHEIKIEAKGNRKLPFWGEKDSFSYYEHIFYQFWGLVIGKNTVKFCCIGTIEKKKIVIPPTIASNLSRSNFNSTKKVIFFHRRKIDETWLEKIQTQEMLLPHKMIEGEALRKIAKSFFEKSSTFSFILDDWIAMRNRLSFSNYSLPELLFNLEGLHRALYPQYEKKSGYKKVINDIHAISPFTQYDQLINNVSSKLPFKQRLQDILLIKTAPFYPYLSVLQKKCIIDYLHDVRNNASHRNSRLDLRSARMIPCVFLCEELIAILIFMNIGLKSRQILTILKNGQEWNNLKEMLCAGFGDKKNVH